MAKPHTNPTPGKDELLYPEYAYFVFLGLGWDPDVESMEEFAERQRRRLQAEREREGSREEGKRGSCGD